MVCRLWSDVNLINVAGECAVVYFLFLFFLIWTLVEYGVAGKAEFVTEHILGVEKYIGLHKQGEFLARQ